MSQVDVLLPYRGDGRFLADALRSLRQQTLTQWRGWLVRDGADSGADALAGQAASADARLRLLPAGDGPAAALRAAASHARAPLLCVLDGDDLLADAGALADMADLLQARPELGLAYSAHRLIDANGLDLGPDPLAELAYSPEALLLDFMVGPLRMIRREAFEAVGGFRDAFPDAAEYDLCLRLSESTQIARRARVLYHRRVHPGSAEVVRWAEGIDARYQAFVAAVRRRGLDARYDCRLHIESRHVLTALRPFGGWGAPGPR